MTATHKKGRTDMTAVAYSPRNASAHRVTFLRSVMSELKKFQLRSFILTGALAIIIYTVLIFFVTNSDYFTAVEVDIITPGWAFLALFFVIIGALSVTHEYSHNTMRTTVLATPNRPVAYLAKTTALTLVASLIAVTTTATSVLIAAMRLGDALEFSGPSIRSIAVFAVLQVLIALMTMGFGYIFRSTAVSIALMVFLLYIIDITSLIPMDLFREVLPKFYPNSLGSEALESPEAFFIGNPIGDPNLALLILVGYTVVALAAGLIRFHRRDV